MEKLSVNINKVLHYTVVPLLFGILFWGDARHLINKDFYGLWVVCMTIAILSYISIVALWGKIKFEYIYLICVSSFGLIFMILLPPGSINDEYFHMRHAYHYSNVLLGEEENDLNREIDGLGIVYVRGSDGEAFVDEVDFWGEKYNYRISTTWYEAMNSLRTRSMENEAMTPVLPGYSKSTNIMEYIPSVLAYSLARVLKLNTFYLIYLGKLFSLVFYIGICFLAVKIIPFYKLQFAIITMLPIALQEAACITYDTVTNAYAFLLIALIFRIIDKKEIDIKHLVVVTVLCGLLAFDKGGIYTIIVGPLLLGIIKGKVKCKMPLLYVLLVVSVTSIIVISLYASNLNVNPALTAGKYSFGYLINSPLEFISMLIKTTVEKGTYYIESALGSYITWDKYYIPSYFPSGVMIIMILSNVYKTTDEYIIDRWYRVVFVLLFVFSFIIMHIILLTDTNIGDLFVYGVQGRYFLPLLPFGFISFAKKPDEEIVFRQEKIYLVSFSILFIIGVYYMLRAFLTIYI